MDGTFFSFFLLFLLLVVGLEDWRIGGLEGEGLGRGLVL